MIKELRNLLSYGKVEKRKIYIIFLLLIWNAIFSFVLPQISLTIFDGAIGKNDVKFLIFLLFIYVIVIVVNNFLVYILNKCYISIGNKFVYNLRTFLIKHILKLDGKFYSSCHAGNIISTIYEDTAIVKNFVVSNFFNTISDLCMGIPVAIIILMIQPQLFFEMLILQPVIYLLQLYFSKRTYNKSKIVRNAASKVGGLLQECVGNLLAIAETGMTNYFSENIKTALKDLQKSNENMDIISVSKNIAMNGILAIWTITMLGLGGYKVIKGDMTVGELMVLIQYSPKLFLPIISILSLKVEGRRVKVSVERLNELIETETDVKIGKIEKGIDEKNCNAIEFNNVSFSYCPEEIILQNLNMKIDSGSFSALVGMSGSGKSTIINLIIRLWNPTEGTIKISEKNIEDFDVAYLRRQIGVISQNVVLVNGSIRDNITLGGEYSIDEVYNILDVCELKDFIINLKEGLDTELGDNGVKISGGQKQRIQIARMLLKKTPILILDEATSALDSIIESQIISNIQNNYKETTILLITHRLWSLDKCDKIYVLSEGKISEEGKYCDLLNMNGIFKNMNHSAQAEFKSEL